MLPFRIASIGRSSIIVLGQTPRGAARSACRVAESPVASGFPHCHVSEGACRPLWGRYHSDCFPPQMIQCSGCHLCRARSRLHASCSDGRVADQVEVAWERAVIKPGHKRGSDRIATRPAPSEGTEGSSRESGEPRSGRACPSTMVAGRWWEAPSLRYNPYARLRGSEDCDAEPQTHPVVAAGRFTRVDVVRWWEASSLVLRPGSICRRRKAADSSRTSDATS